MSQKPRDITLERVNRLAQAVADLSESHAAQGRLMGRLLTQISDQLGSLDAKLGTLSQDVRNLAGEQMLLGNRIEEAFARASRANIRLDEIEDAK